MVGPLLRDEPDADLPDGATWDDGEPRGAKSEERGLLASLIVRRLPRPDVHDRDRGRQPSGVEQIGGRALLGEARNPEVLAVGREAELLGLSCPREAGKRFRASGANSPNWMRIGCTFHRHGCDRRGKAPRFR